MFQCTVSTKHALKPGIFDTLELLDSSIDLSLYVVVPDEDTFTKWTKGMKVPKIPPTASAKVKQHCKNLKRFVARINEISPLDI